MQLFTNNATSSLNGAIATDTLTLTLQAGEGARFPAPTGGDFFLVTLHQNIGGVEVNHEIMKCTARVADDLTVVRAQEGTIGIEFNNGDPVQLRATAASMTDPQIASLTIAGNTQSGTNTGNETAETIGVLIGGATDKTTPVDADYFSIRDSVTGVLQKLSWASIKTMLSGLYAALGGNASQDFAVKILTAANVINQSKGADIASTATINLTTATGNLVHVTGTTTITAVTLGSGMQRTVVFDGVLTLTHHATSNNLPLSANITTAAGDRAQYVGDGTTVRCISFTRANGALMADIQSLGNNPATTTGLTYGFFGGLVKFGAANATVATGTVELYSSSTNYIETDAAGIVTATLTPAGNSSKYQLARVITDAGGITAIYDSRSLFNAASWIATTGDVTGSGVGSIATSIANSAVTLAKMANMATGSLFYRKTAGSGVPEVQTLATLKTDLGLTGTNSGDQTSVTGSSGSCTGNAATATALQTARNINGVSFNGTANITVVDSAAARLAGSSAQAFAASTLTTASTITATGAIYSSSNITAYYSDDRLKTRVSRIENALEKVRSLTAFLYVNNALANSFGYTDDRVQVALSAQEVERVQPEVVSLAPFDMVVNEAGEVDPLTSKSGENYKTVNYARLVPLLVAAIQEQQLQIEELKARLA